MRDTTLMAQRFDPDRLTLSGQPAPIAEQIAVGGSTGRSAALSVSRNGVMVYQTGGSAVQTRLAWYDRSGKQLEEFGEPGDFGDIELSPDGSRIAAAITDAGQRSRNLWLVDVKRGLRTRLTFDADSEFVPIWSPDGSHLIYTSQASGQRLAGGVGVRIVRRSADGSGGAETLHADDNAAVATSIDADGRSLLLSVRGSGGTSDTDVYRLPLTGDRRPAAFVKTPFNDAFGRYSPDGRWVAYQSNESSGPEVYVVPASGQGKWRVSERGGSVPRWRRDGKELYYVDRTLKLIAAEVSGGPTSFTVGAIHELFQLRAKNGVNYVYDVSADGRKILVIGTPTVSVTEPLTIVVNWPAQLQPKP